MKPLSLNNRKGLCGYLLFRVATIRLTLGELGDEGSAVEGEGAPSDEQTEEGQSRIEGSGDVGLEIDCRAVDATVAVDRGSECGRGLVGGEAGVLDIEELRANLENAVGFVLATVYPCYCPIADGGGGAKKTLDGGEAELVDDRPQDGGVVGVEDYLVSFDGGTRGARGGIEGLAADEAGELVVGFKVGVAFKDGSSELADGCGGGDAETAEADARLGEASGGLREGDT